MTAFFAQEIASRRVPEGFTRSAKGRKGQQPKWLQFGQSIACRRFGPHLEVFGRLFGALCGLCHVFGVLLELLLAPKAGYPTLVSLWSRWLEAASPFW